MLLKPYFQGRIMRTGAPSCGGSVSPNMPDSKQRQRMHGFVHAQAFHVGELQPGGVRHLLAVVEGFERDVVGFRGGLHLA